MEQHTLILWAAAIAGISAVSLPLGSIMGLRIKASPSWISILTAFGAGALLAALSIELIATNVLEALHDTDDAASARQILVLIFSCLAGGFLYVLLDQAVNSRGGFLRKTATSIRYMKGLRTLQKQKTIKELSSFSVLKGLDAESLEYLASSLNPVEFADDEMITRQGEEPKGLFFLVSGKVILGHQSESLMELQTGSVFGIAPLVHKTAVPVDCSADGKVKAYLLPIPKFEALMDRSPEFRTIMEKTMGDRLTQAHGLLQDRTMENLAWKQQLVESIRVGSVLPSTGELRDLKNKFKGASLAIWLGMLLDGIPESLVIGSNFFTMIHSLDDPTTIRIWDAIPYTLLAGLFLSNFPEAWASSANMKRQGWKDPRIFFMWFVLMVFTAIGGACGFLLADSLSGDILLGMEGLAAGAMLTMIVAAMIPEAVHLGKGNMVGLSVLLGFLTAIAFKLLE